MLLARTPRYISRLAETGADLHRARRLRHRAFYEQRRRAARPGLIDADPFDTGCAHVLVEHADGGLPVCTFRLRLLADGGALRDCYSARHYGLDGLAGFAGPMAELGRFCLCPGTRDPDILRLAWAAITRLVDENAIALIFGCTSLPGTDPAAFGDAFGHLAQNHLGPPGWRPRMTSPDAVPLAGVASPRARGRDAVATMPPLLRFYLALGGWVSDHVVIDHDLGTMHLFTGLQVDAIPPSRQRLLRADAALAAGQAPRARRTAEAAPRQNLGIALAGRCG